MFQLFVESESQGGIHGGVNYRGESIHEQEAQPTDGQRAGMHGNERAERQELCRREHSHAVQDCFGEGCALKLDLCRLQMGEHPEHARLAAVSKEKPECIGGHTAGRSPQDCSDQACR